LIVYFDTSALVKLFVKEAGAEIARDTAARANIVATSILAYAEARSAFSRKRRFGEITADQLDRVKEEFEATWEDLQIVPVDENIVRRAGNFAETYSLKGFDAVHLASADTLLQRFEEITFACFDADLSRAPDSRRMMLLPSS
jgi:predicted nucleic acid-binding protein